MILSKPISTLIIALSLIFSYSAYCDHISLKNGDRINGKLISQDDISITWESELFGILKIPLDQILVTNKVPEALPSTADVSKKSTLEGIVGLSGIYLGGNEERDDFDLDIGITFEKKNITHKAALNYQTLGQENEATINDYGIEYGIDWLISDSWYWGNNFFYGADDKRQIDQSVSVGTNIGYQFWKNNKGNLSTETGLRWIDEKLTNSESDKRLAWAWSANYQKQLIERVSLLYSHQLNVSLKDSDNKQLTAEIGVNMPVTHQLNAKIVWDWAIDNQPQSGNEKVDRKLKFGVDYYY